MKSIARKFRVEKVGSYAALMLSMTGGQISVAHAQRADDNAITSADDAFGTSVGNYGVGLYNPFDVRGFSAVDAGNIRLEGLYIDSQTAFTSHLVAGSTIRVGLSAQGYPFPAPTGIADFRIRKAGKSAILSPAINLGPFNGVDVEFDAQLPVAEGLAIATGAGLYWSKFETGSGQFAWSAALVPRWQPNDAIEIMPFISKIHYDNSEAFPLVFSGGNYLPPTFKRGRFYGQDWADGSGNNYNTGLISRFALSTTTELRVGAFRSIAEVATSFADIFDDTQPDGTAHHFIVANPDQKFASSSGEIRLSRIVTEGPRRHVIHLSARGREQKRRYGGGDIVDLGFAAIGVPRPLPRPQFSFGPQTFTRVGQLTGGIAYEGRWREIGELILGIQKSVYEKMVRPPAPAAGTKNKDSPILFNVGGAAYVSDQLSVYAGHTRGLEEGGVAPPNASNRNSAAPAIRTQQTEAGMKYEIKRGLNFVAGVFDVRKPYFNVDENNFYRQLGQVRNQGIELSLAGTLMPGLNTVIGSVLLRPRVSGEEVDAGRIGPAPIGSAARTVILNADYRPPWAPAFSVDATITNLSRRIASADNQLAIPGRTVLDVGGRYRFEVGKAPVTLRVAVGNVFDNFGWRVDRSGIFFHNAQRRFSLNLAADL
ncbi:MAG: TonB-dependent receptor [Sphingosinicella sp.]|nr:TonB-dependent receptor [Sphingosinicella sp.]